jgi:tape measure domain-containing protein
VADLSKTVSIIFTGEDRASAAIKGIESGLDGLGTNAGEAAGKVDQLDGELDKVGQNEAGINRAVEAMKALAAALVVKEFIDANVAAEQFRKTMELATGSSEAAAAEYEYIKEVSDRLGLSLRGAADSYAKFASATKGSALEGESARVIFEAFAGTMSAAGASAADVQGAMVQLAQGVSKGKFELEDLKSIAERVPGFFTKFSDSLGVTTEELFDLVSAGKITGAEILIFAESLNRGLEGVNFDGFINSLNRFKNAQDDAFVQIGDAGAFDILTKGLQAGTASIVGAIAAFTLLGEIIGAVAGAIATGDFSGLGRAFDDAMTKAAEKTTLARDRLFNLREEVQKSGEAGTEAGDKIEAGMQKGKEATVDLVKASGEVDKALKALGLDPNQFKDPIDAILKAFTDLANNPAVRGDQFLSALLVTLDKIENGPKGAAALEEVVRGIAKAYENGTISAEEYTAAINALNTKQDGTWQSMVRTTKEGDKTAESLDKQAAAAKKAEEETKKYALELEKLASNERIALIEAKVQLNVAELEADTERVKAAFSSIDNTVNSTGELIGKLFGQLFDDTNFFKDTSLIEDQLDKENKARQDAFELQKKLTEEQIRALRARTDAINRGDTLIKIDGAGLQPQLEAFMWEILRTIQVRVNADGLDLLVGA